VRTAVDKVSVRKHEVGIQLTTAASTNVKRPDHSLPHDSRIERHGSVVSIVVPMTLNLRGGIIRLLDPFGRSAAGPRGPDPTLTRGIARAHIWRAQILSGEVGTFAEIATEEGVTEAFVRARLRLAYLSPEMVGGILRGLQPDGLTLEQIIDADFSVVWQAQGQQFVFAGLARSSRDAQR